MGHTDEIVVRGLSAMIAAEPDFVELEIRVGGDDWLARVHRGTCDGQALWYLYLTGPDGYYQGSGDGMVSQESAVCYALELAIELSQAKAEAEAAS